MKHIQRISVSRADATDDFMQEVYLHWKDWLYATDRGYIDIYDFLTGAFDLSGLRGKRER